MVPILIVDDERAIRHVLARWLSDAGYRCAEAETADAALASMASDPSAVVLCDVQMPGHDGLWLTRQLRTQYPATAIVLVTGITTVPPSMSMQAGVLAYLVKPFQRETLLEAVQQGVKWHEQAVASGDRTVNTQDLDQWLDRLEQG
jgi:DNA-binding NtrC family response regulator